MPKVVSSRVVERVLVAHGFKFVSQKGSHAKFVKDSRVVIVPMAKRDIPFGTMRFIARQSMIPLEIFQKK